MLLRVFSFLLTIGVKHFTGKPHLGWAERVVRGKYKSCGEYAPFKWCPFRAPVMYSCCICDIQCNAYTCTCRAISRKIVGKIVHVTILKGNMGCNQYTVPDTTIVVRKHVHGLSSCSFKFLWRRVNSKPPTIPLGIVTCTSSDNLSQNSCIL